MDQAECGSLPPLAVLPDYSMTLSYESLLFSQTQTLRRAGGCSSAPVLRIYCGEANLACSDSFSACDLSDFCWSSHVEHLCATASPSKDWQRCLGGERKNAMGLLQCQETSGSQALAMRWGFPRTRFWGKRLAARPSPAGYNQYFTLGSDAVGVGTPSTHRWG